MELLGDVGQMEARFSLFGDNVNLDTCTVCIELVEIVCINRSVYLETVLVSTSDRCTVCAE
jgi:hypothetical protein